MNKILFILSFFVAIMTVSCSDESQNVEPVFPDVLSPLTICATVNGAGTAVTRATKTDINDLWSYVSFEKDDEMGFYASGGKYEAGENKPFVNHPLIYSSERDRFVDKENGSIFSPTHMKGSDIYMYFPYDANIAQTGMELRVLDNEKDDKILRCVDFLSSNSIEVNGVDKTGVTLYGAFSHAFSELIIVRGEGFDDPPAGCERITAVLSEPVTHIQIEEGSDGTWKCTPKLVYDESASSLTGEDDEKRREQARKWNAWHGDKYRATESNEEGKDAWYVIVPTLSGNRSLVEYIELYDNEGNLQRVSSLQLADDGKTKYVAPGQRYPMIILMRELVPTANPCTVRPWNDDVDLTDTRGRGINNEVEFAQWVRDYTTYLADKSQQSNIDALYKYGDSYIDNDGTRSWHFYVLSDLDFTKYLSLLSDEQGNTSNVIIPKLCDILDGISTTLVNSKFINHTIKGLDKTFIDQLTTSNGSIQNFDFIDPQVHCEESSTEPAGIIVNTMEKGSSVINCNITGYKGVLFNPGGPGGMVAGSMTNGIVRDCVLSGILIVGETATGEAAKIIGKLSGNNTLERNDASDVSTNEEEVVP